MATHSYQNVSNTLLGRAEPEDPLPIFISLAKWKAKPTKDMVEQADKLWARFRKEGGEVLSAYWTIGRYDAVITLKAPTETAALKALMRWGDLLNTETLLAIPREDAVKLLD